MFAVTKQICWRVREGSKRNFQQGARNGAIHCLFCKFSLQSQRHMAVDLPRYQDEIDALATSRTDADTAPGSHNGVLTSLLNEMDGVQELIGVTVVAATNRPAAIVGLIFAVSLGNPIFIFRSQDSALLRPGRLDRLLYVGPPDLSGREEILAIRMRGMSTTEDVDISEIARLASRICFISVISSILIANLDRGVLRRRNIGSLSRSSIVDNEERHECTKRNRGSPLSLTLILLIQIFLSNLGTARSFHICREKDAPADHQRQFRGISEMAARYTGWWI
jgi:hypothetical protein